MAGAPGFEPGNAGIKTQCLNRLATPQKLHGISFLTLALARIIPYLHVRHPAGRPTAVQILLQTNLSNQEMLGSKPSALTAWPRPNLAVPPTHLISGNNSNFFPVPGFPVPGALAAANDSDLSPQIPPSLEAISHRRILPVADYQIQQKHKILSQSFWHL